MDLSDTLAPNSDQLDAVDLLSGPRTFVIEGVAKGDAEQPVNIHLADFPRPWRPGKSMRRVLVACWGPDAGTYVGRRVRLYCDPDVRFGGQAVGGTRIAALSHIDKPKQVPLLVSRGKNAIFVVQPLTEPAQSPPGRASQPTGDTITPEQLKRLHASLGDAGLSDRDKGLAYISEVVGRAITSSKELTKAEASRVIEALNPEPPEPTFEDES